MECNQLHYNRIVDSFMVIRIVDIVEPYQLVGMDRIPRICNHRYCKRSTGKHQAVTNFRQIQNLEVNFKNYYKNGSFRRAVFFVKKSSQTIRKSVYFFRFAKQKK